MKLFTHREALFQKASLVEDDGCLLWTGRLNAKGYGYIAVWTEGRYHYFMAHRHAWERRHGAIPPGQVVMHTCDRRPCVREAHLLLGSQAENIADMVVKGRQARGERNHRAKLTEVEVLEIRRRMSQGASGPELARQFGVSHGVIYGIKNGRIWTHVGLPA